MTPTDRTHRTVDVLVIGAGPAGLAVAARLAAAGVDRVEVLDREQRAGGIPRHCDHIGFGLRDLRRVMTGPDYARHHIAAAIRAGAVLRTGVAATGWAGPRTVDITGPTGLERITATAVVLATGARERPRGARLVPGTRPAGVFTTGQLQQAVHVHHQSVGRRAVIVGAERVSYSAVATLRRAGAGVVAMVTDQPRHQTHPARHLGIRLRHGVPLVTDATVAELTGRARLESVRLRHRDGRFAAIGCDTVVFTGDWIPDHELARSAGIALDPGTRGPATDAEFRTGAPGVFAVGNLLHPVETADIAALDGRFAAEPVLRHLAGVPWTPGPLPVRVEAPLLWISPNRLTPDGPRPPRGRFTLRTTRFLTRPVLTVSQDGRTLHRGRLPHTAAPNRPFHLPADWIAGADAHGGPVRITAG
ncbi:NAD(P)/FAD-dependent oxidoreductase [Streptomyces rugosispiralis]|uniref:NAD(P)/FAD-dependent oxidoreductase n=1 Tax=Streptomyces rugosispiralis TaxID=2967341 RepID=A0ABT1V2H5_9ACTN|nr:FAD-dependent oxidoreductase [Streptomyces rugosispiralis]MCQ8190756.1 NAD(P)/FAD-dependent oxidoreductase [Streptomyces rugosispiralis]